MRLRPFWKPLFAVIWLVAVARVDAGDLRVAVFSPEGDRETEDLCIATVSAVPDVRVVERRALNALLGERALQQALASVQTRAYAGQLSGADVVLSVRKTAAGILVEAVSVGTGVVIGRSGPAELPALAGQVRGLLASVPGLAKGPRVAVADFAGDGFSSAVELRENLRAEGFTIVDRAVIEHAVAETALGRAGVVSVATPPNLLGADYLVRGERRGGVLALSVLGTAGGSLVAAKEFAADENGLAQTGWLKNVLPPPPPQRVSLEPGVQVEALVPLYEGVARFRDGDIRGALSAFWKAQELDDKFQEALAWEARCYDAAGLPRLGEAVRRYSRECLVGRGISTPTRNIPAEGVTFLGIQGETSPALEMQAMNALLKAAPGRVVLPEHLALYRDEYDALIGAGKAEPGWARAPGFLTRWSLRGTSSAGGVRWTLFDTLSGRIAAVVEDKAFPFGRLLLDAKATGVDPVPATKLALGGSSAPRLQADIGSGDPEHANFALLELLINDPASPALWGRRFQRGDTERDGIGGFLNFALREHLIAVLPADNEQRAWLRLAQTGLFLPWEPNGRLFSGENRDPLAELEAFIGEHPADAPGAVARYLQLYEVMDSLPATEAARRWREVDALVTAAGATPQGKRHPAQFAFLSELSGHLAAFTAVAADAPGAAERGLPMSGLAVRLRLEVMPDGATHLFGTSSWFCNEWTRVTVPRELQRLEAVAALHILGRRNNLIRVPASWMEESPDSITLLSFAIKSLHEVDHPYGAPSLQGFDVAAARANHLRIVAYCERGLHRWLERTQDERTLRFLSECSRNYIWYLTRYAYADSLPDERFYAIQKNLAAAVSATAVRLGRPAETGGGYWTKMPRRMSEDIWAVWSSSLQDPCDYDELMVREAAAARSSFSPGSSPVTQTAWWQLMGGWEIPGLRPEKRAEIALRHVADMERLFPAGEAGNLGFSEAAFIHNYALFLLLGRRYAEAEPWFRQVAEAPDGDLLRTHGARELRASARLHLAFCLVAMNRPDEALRLAKACAEIPAGQKPYRLLGYIYAGSSSPRITGSGSLRSTALRFMRDLRLASESDIPPANIRRVLIPIRGGNGARAMFFLRIPPNAGTAAGTRPVLVLAPSLHHGVGEYMQDSNAWARFADEQGFFLLVPEFNWAAGEGGDGVRFWYHDAANWSGEALLTAVDWIARTQPAARTDRLLLHGYGGGGQFVQRFARWAPERCLAISAHSTGGPGWMDGMPRLKPFSALRDVPMLLTCGAADDLRICFYDRLAMTGQYAAMALAGGVDVTWLQLENTGHVPTPELEKRAQTFLADKARTP